MNSFIGDYACKIDEKGRLLLPAAFKKALPAEAHNTFVVKKDIYEPCLVLYPLNEWDKQVQIIRQRLNPYNREHNAFLRGFFKGTAEIELDATNRLLIPKRLLEEVKIEREVILSGQDGKIEIWNKDAYENISRADEFARLAEKIMGGDFINNQ
ncbi:MAG: division/cell wall cluster transcriptional repressor MraZ [Bacteroidales bacterium]|nr:division/cell wall cluster transcriptional repressor MraZ [Bacteroidales bacterium]